MKRRPWRRKTVFVDGKVQTRIILATSLPMFGCLLLAIGGEVLYFRLVDAGRIETSGTIFGMPEHRLGMLLLFVSASTIQLIASLLASQKVAGVSYHIRRILREFREGKRDARVRLRQGDYQLGLGDDVNEFLDWLTGDGGASSGRAAPHEAHAGPGPEPAPRGTIGSAPGSPAPSVTEESR